MRHTGLALTALVLAVTAAAAQQQGPQQQRPAQPAAAPADPRLDGYLARWEQEMQRVQTLQAQLIRLDNEKAFGTVQKLVGYAQYMKVGSGASAQNLAVLQLSHENKREIAEKYVCTGTYIYQFAPAQKEIKVIELPKPAAGREEDSSFLSFLFGMRAADGVGKPGDRAEDAPRSDDRRRPRAAGAAPAGRRLSAMWETLAPYFLGAGAAFLLVGFVMLVAAALTLGGSIRVGLEDNFYLPDGAMARSNGDLVAKARQMAEDAGRRPATVEEARALLGIAAGARA